MHLSIRILSLLILFVLVFELDPVVYSIHERAHGLFLNLSNTSLDFGRRAVTQEALLAVSVSENQYNDVTFVGDVLLARNVEILMNRYGESYPFAGLDLSTLGSQSAIVANFESAIPKTHIPTPAFQLSFSTPKIALSALSEAGYTHVSVANNHSLDFGVPALANTIQMLTDEDIRVFGETSVFEYDSIATIDTIYGSVALIGFDDTMKPLSQAEIARVLKKAGRMSDMQIVYVHWGIEYDLEASKRQKNVAKWFVEAGADVVVGHHPHVVQEIEVIDGVPILYSLGNYIFDQYFSEAVQQGLVATISFKPEPKIILTPVESTTQLSQPRQMAGDERASFLYQLSNRSDVSIANHIRRGNVPLDNIFASALKIAMITE